MSKIKKNVIAQVGSFVVTHEHGPEHDYVRIKAVSGSWAVMHRDDSPMYGAWLAMAKDPEYTNAIEMLNTMSYTLTNSILDEGFVRDYFNALDAMSKRREDAAPTPTEQEEADAIAEVKLMEDIKENLKG